MPPPSDLPRPLRWEPRGHGRLEAERVRPVGDARGRPSVEPLGETSRLGPEPLTQGRPPPEAEQRRGPPLTPESPRNVRARTRSATPPPAAPPERARSDQRPARCESMRAGTAQTLPKPPWSPPLWFTGFGEDPTGRATVAEDLRRGSAIDPVRRAPSLSRLSCQPSRSGPPRMPGSVRRETSP